MRSVSETVRQPFIQLDTLSDNCMSGGKLRCACSIWSSVLKGMSPKTMAYKRIPKLHTVRLSHLYCPEIIHSGGEYTRVPERIQIKKCHYSGRSKLFMHRFFYTYIKVQILINRVSFYHQSRCIFFYGTFAQIQSR